MNHPIVYLSIFILTSVTSTLLAQKSWTIMHYAAGSNSSETDLMYDIEEMKRGKQSTAYNFICLIDRIEGFSEDSLALDGNFTDTRLYQIEHMEFKRLDGKEYFPDLDEKSTSDLNMGDAKVLKSFIEYCKKYYPADHYMLIMRSHGNGMGMCPDIELSDRDRIYPSEMSDVLSAEESVDILGLDVCSMAGLENLYQWRPRENYFSAEYVIASAPLSGAWAYDEILERITKDKSGSDVLDPEHMSALDLAKMIYDEVYENQGWASWGLFDNRMIGDVKVKIDEAAVLLSQENSEPLIELIESALGYYHNTSDQLELAQLGFPYLDAYDFWNQISKEAHFMSSTRMKAKEICEALDSLVVHSYYGRGYLPETDNFVSGVSGVYQIIPLGNRIFSQTNRTFWSHSTWFHSKDRTNADNSYGKYDWCIDPAVPGNQKVENFFELLDLLFDESNDRSGGVNEYQW